MEKKHPKKALLFIGLCDFTAILLCIWSIKQINLASINVYTFVIWLLLVCIARHGGLFRFVDSKIAAGAANIFEFTASIVLPFSLFSISILISCFVNMYDRFRKGHKEPFLGPDFNAANVIIGGAVSTVIFNMMMNSNTSIDSPLYMQMMVAIAILIRALIYGGVQLLLLSTLISLDEKIKWKRAPTLQRSVVLTELIIVIMGALIAVMYQFNPFLLGILVIPALLVQRLLQEAERAKLIYIDVKTGLYNYRYFDEKMNELFEKSKRTGETLTLLFADMDYLRNINNNYGHAVGDEAIEAIGRTFKQFQTENIIPTRFGGEEFVVIMSGISKEGGYQIAEKIRKKVEEIVLKSEQGEIIQLSVSIGVATFPQDAVSSQELIQAADTALYAAKHSGRNRVCLYEKLHDSINLGEVSDHGS